MDNLMLRITYNCNKKCFYCFNSVFEEKLCAVNENINVDQINCFIVDNNVKNVFISGGEPTVSDNFEKIMNNLSKDVRKIVFSNGLLLKTYDQHQIKNFDIDVIDISFDDEDIINNSESCNEIISLIKKVKNEEEKIVINAEVMIDINYFDIINSEFFDLMHTTVDNIIWQPLALPKSHPLYSITLEGMDTDKRERILTHLKTSFDNPSIVKAIECYLKNSEKSVNCKMGIDYIVLNPNMTLSICPHLNASMHLEKFNEKAISLQKNCIGMRCLCLYNYLNKRLDKENII